MSPVRFNPTGSLDIASDPADLPEESTSLLTPAKSNVSGAMTRCTNLDLDRAGIARTRRGSAKINSVAIDSDISLIIEQVGTRYTFAGPTIYQDEVSIGTGFTEAAWSAILYNSYATTVQSVFALNGTDRKRIEGANVYEWGSESPTVAPTLSAEGKGALTGDYNAKYTWVRKEDVTIVWESNPSPEGTAVTLASQNLGIIYTLPTDTQITHVRIYRTLTDGAVYYYDQEIAIITQDTTEYEYGYMYDWELAYIHDDIEEYAYSYTYDWEIDYISAPNYQAFIEDTANEGFVTYSWELAAGYAGTDSGYKYTYPWEVIYCNEQVFSGEAYQAFTEDTDNSGIAMYSWELVTGYTGVDGGYKGFFPWEINLQIETTYTNTEDDSLGIECAWVNHNRPPLDGTVVLGPTFSGICFILKDNLLHYCLPNQPEYWPDTYYIEVTPLQIPLKAGCFVLGQLMLASATEIYAIQGNGPGTFAPLSMSAQTGAVNANCFVPITGYGVFHFGGGGDGIFQYAGMKDQLITRGQFEPLFRGETRGNIPGLNRSYLENCWLKAYHNKLYFGYPGGTSVYPDNILVMDLATNRTVHHDYAFDFRTVAIDTTNSRLLAGDTSGYIWQWENVDLTDDDTTAIAWQIQSKDFNQYYKYFPRYAKYDVNVNGGSANGYIILDDVIVQTHTISGDRLTKKRLVAGCTGDRLAVRLSGSGGVQIYGVEIE